MKDIPKIELATKSTPEQLKEGADLLRDLADKIQLGEVQAFCYAAIAGGNLKVEYIKPKGITILEMIGAAGVLHDHIVNAMKSGEE